MRKTDKVTFRWRPVTRATAEKLATKRRVPLGDIIEQAVATEALIDEHWKGTPSSAASAYVEAEHGSRTDAEKHRLAIVKALLDAAQERAS
jgi:hypothetical protein